MVKRKAFLPLEEKLAKPWCYYCGKEWVDNKVLLSHMRDVHLKCDSCYRRLNTAGGLKVHKEQVHKEQLHRIENALPGRESIDIEVFVMEGIPEELVQARRKAIAEEHYREQNEYVQRTGNLPPGSTEPNPHLKKKPKLESKEELKARVAALKQKREAEKAAKANGSMVGVKAEYGSDNASPSPAPATSPGSSYQGHSRGPMSLPTFAPSFASPQAMHMHDASPYPAFPTPYGHPPNPDQSVYGPPAYSPHQSHPGQALFGPPAYSMAPAAPAQAMYAPPAYSPAPSGHQGSPPAPVMRESSANTANASSGPSTLPPVPGLPPRPNFTVPNVSKEQMAQLHGVPPAHLHSKQPANVSNYAPPATAAVWNHRTGAANYPVGSASHEGALDSIQHDRRDTAHQPRVVNDDVDDYILRITTQGLQKTENQSAFAASQNHTSDGKGLDSIRKTSPALTQPPPEIAVAQESQPKQDAAQELSIKTEPAILAESGSKPKPNAGATAKKTSKKQKGQRNRTKLIYSDNTIAPEEKKAKLEQYSPHWDMHKLPDTTLGSAEDAVTGVVDGTVRDPQG